MDAFLYGLYESAVRHSTVDQLLRCPPLAPLPGQVAILHEVVRWARTQGLRFPAKFTVRWVQGRKGISPGCISSSSHVVTLDGMAYPLDLRRTIAHELQHLHDFVTGQWGAEIEQRVAMEHRADLFAARCVEAFWNHP